MDSSHIIFKFAKFTDRLGNPANETNAFALQSCTGHKLSAFTRQAEIEEMALAIATLAKENFGYLEASQTSLIQELANIQSDFQLRDDDWGALSPYLEELLHQEHPNVRLKPEGKYNPDNRHKVLIRLYVGDGGWRPAEVIPSLKAEEQWALAGIPYPSALKRRTSDSEDRTTEKVRDKSLGEAVSRRRYLKMKISEMQSELDELTRVIREDNRLMAKHRLPELAKAALDESDTNKRNRLLKALIETTLNIIAIDQEIHPEAPEFMIFGHAYNAIERDIGRDTSPAGQKADQDRLAEAAQITATLIAALPESSDLSDIKDYLSQPLKDHFKL